MTNGASRIADSREKAQKAQKLTANAREFKRTTNEPQMNAD
jgi:hypothetical protein